jgi:hypothetical protein
MLRPAAGQAQRARRRLPQRKTIARWFGRERVNLGKASAMEDARTDARTDAAAVRTVGFGRRRRMYRAPLPDMTRPYMACIGTERTFARGVARPWPDLAGEATGLPALNLGVDGAGPGFFLADPMLMEACSNAALCVVEIGSAWNLSNRFYTVGRRHNRRLRGVSDVLHALFADVDFNGFAFVGKMLEHLRAKNPAAFAMVEAECRSAWSARMRTLLEGIDTPTALLWFSHHRPEDHMHLDPRHARSVPPDAVTREMIEQARRHADGYAEVILAGGGGGDRAALTQKMHVEIAAAVAAAAGALIR